ncbi:bacteriophage N4 receptor, outer membrane subunit [Aeoliella mucimassa]|uniref:Bacteriophage N4 receptor, outer membrane subunit n=2 Tax=Aeoliella mucimassa TaxID=2527972 RepID=A0A518AKW6_9BACT|nr:bacteriophage N4 receptor, outer membrane subunit [Aeoliella mucimassa]
MLLIDRGEFPRAIEQLTQILEHNPNSAQPLAMIGFCKVAQGEHENGLQIGRAAVSLAPSDPYTHYLLTFGLLFADQLEAAEAALAVAMELSPDEPAFFVLQSRLKIASKDWDAALASANEALSLDPSFVSAHSLRSTAQLMLKNNTAASESAASALALDPEDSTAHASLGWALLESGHVDEARQAFCESLTIDPNSSYAIKGLVETQKSNRWLINFWRKGLLWVGLQNPHAITALWANILLSALVFAVVLTTGFYFPMAWRFAPLPLASLVFPLSCLAFYGAISAALISNDPLVRAILDSARIRRGYLLIVIHALFVLLIISALLTASPPLIATAIALGLVLEGAGMWSVSRKKVPLLERAFAFTVCLSVGCYGCLFIGVGGESLSQITSMAESDLSKWAKYLALIPFAIYASFNALLLRNKKPSS